MKNFVILGAGTAGWITALSLRKFFPQDNITMIRAKDIPIIGVGEATTPQILNFLRSCDIDIGHFLKETGGSIKHAISFENWNGDGTKYLHPFVEEVANFAIPGIFDHSCFDFYVKRLISDNLPFDEFMYQNKLANECKVDIDNTVHALHFDTARFGEYLEKICRSRNVNIIEDKYIDVEQDKNGMITSLILEEQKINCDFVFDCSGMHRQIIGKAFKEKWISYTKYLPMKKAIPFWLDPQEKIPPYTVARALKYGWMWQIPLQHRIGAGYVFDSDYIDEHEAQKEVEEHLGHSVEVRKVIDIDAGRYENVWIKNCIAVGLAGNFIEPLESTSIWLQLALMTNLKQFLHTIDDLDQSEIDLFNEIIGNEVDEKMNFVHLHYLGKRNDSPFWKEFKEKTETPEIVKKLLPYVKKGKLQYHYLQKQNCPAIFPLMSWLWICKGLHLIEEKINQKGYERLTPSPMQYRQEIDHMINYAPDHRQFLENLK